MTTSANVCPKCAGQMEPGFATALGLLGGSGAESNVPRLIFVTEGILTSRNPIRAFQQGLANEPANREFRLRGERCAACGYVELFATEQ